MIEKAGRKQLLNQSYTGMAITMLVMAAGFGLPALAAYSGTIALVGTLLYILSFAVGAGPVSGLIVPEINNAVVRGEGGKRVLGRSSRGAWDMGMRLTMQL